jgi:hypothetical protein
MKLIELERFPMLTAKLKHGNQWQTHAMSRIFQFAQRLEHKSYRFNKRKHDDEVFIELSKTALNIVFPKESQAVNNIEYQNLMFVYSPEQGLRKDLVLLCKINDDKVNILMNPALDDNHVHIHNKHYYFLYILVD